jgi:MHS family proline/betaine transporter-like MFS transporter
VLDIEAEIADLEEKLEALRQRRQRLADRHPDLE